MRVALSATIGLFLSGCTSSGLIAPKTLGEANSGYNYVALDPLPVKASLQACKSRRGDKHSADWMDALPDNAVRIAIDDLSGKAGGAIGPVVVEGGGGIYRVILDYVNVDTTNIRFQLSGENSGEILKKIAGGDFSGLKVKRLTDDESTDPSKGQEIVVPVYVGVGLRLTALISVQKGKVNLASLGAIAAAAEANHVAGTLTVQTLGLSGQQVSSSLPLPSELNPTTVQNAIQSLGAIKAIMFDKDTMVAPRVTGIYNPLRNSDPALINAIVSQLASRPIEWKPCLNS